MLVHVLHMRTCDKEGLRVPLNLSTTVYCSLSNVPIKATHALISILHTKFTRAEPEKPRYQAKHSLWAVQGINLQRMLQNVLKIVFIAFVFRWCFIQKYQKETALQ